MYIINPKMFCLQELVWKSIYEYYEKRNQLWVLQRKFPVRFLKTLEQLHEYFGTAIINTWHFKNSVSWLYNQIFEFSGARPLNIVIKTTEKKILNNPFIITSKRKLWSEGTTHYNWDTADVKFTCCAVKGIENRKKKYDEIRNIILNNPELFPYITVMESGKYSPTWLHFSVGNFPDENNNIRIVEP